VDGVDEELDWLCAGLETAQETKRAASRAANSGILEELFLMPHLRASLSLRLYTCRGNRFPEGRMSRPEIRFPPVLGYLKNGLPWYRAGGTKRPVDTFALPI
jgi:hypothetical protein